MSNRKLKNAPVFTMDDIRERYFPNAIRPNGSVDNRTVLRAFKEGRIIGTPTRYRVYTDKKTGIQRRFVSDFIVSK